MLVVDCWVVVPVTLVQFRAKPPFSFYFVEDFNLDDGSFNNTISLTKLVAVKLNLLLERELLVGSRDPSYIFYIGNTLARKYTELGAFYIMSVNKKVGRRW